MYNMKKKNTEFQVGDRVVVVRRFGNAAPPVGMKGVVARLSDHCVGVRFEGWDGHNLDIQSDPLIRNGWWMFPVDIELADDVLGMNYAAMDIKSLFE